MEGYNYMEAFSEWKDEFTQMGMQDYDVILYWSDKLARLSRPKDTVVTFDDMEEPTKITIEISVDYGH